VEAVNLEAIMVQEDHTMDLHPPMALTHPILEVTFHKTETLTKTAMVTTEI
jgi:hypothetical protein